MGTVTEEDLYDAEVTSVYGTIKVKLGEARDQVSDVVYTRQGRPLWPIFLAVVIGLALVADGLASTVIGLPALMLLLVREVQR